jgi:hypothetical protein
VTAAVFRDFVAPTRSNGKMNSSTLAAQRRKRKIFMQTMCKRLPVWRLLRPKKYQTATQIGIVAEVMSMLGSGGK